MGSSIQRFPFHYSLHGSKVLLFWYSHFCNISISPFIIFFFFLFAFYCSTSRFDVRVVIVIKENVLRLGTVLYAFQAQTSRMLLGSPISFLLIDGAVMYDVSRENATHLRTYRVSFPYNFFRSQQPNPVLLSTSPTLNEPGQKPSFIPISPQDIWLLSNLSASLQAACLPTLAS